MKKQKVNTYGVRLSGLWLSFRLMKFFALFNAKKSAESIQLHINEAAKNVTSVINRLCANYIACHRDLIIRAFLNRNSKNAEETSGKTIDGADENKSIIQRKRELLNAENARNAARIEKARKAESDATLLTYENELTDYINFIVDKANSYVNAYLRKIERKHSEMLNKIKNPFDDFEFNVYDYSLRLEDAGDDYVYDYNMRLEERGDV